MGTLINNELLTVSRRLSQGKTLITEIVISNSTSARFAPAILCYLFTFFFINQIKQFFHDFIEYERFRHKFFPGFAIHNFLLYLIPCSIFCFASLCIYASSDFSFVSAFCFPGNYLVIKVIR